MNRIRADGLYQWSPAHGGGHFNFGSANEPCRSGEKAKCRTAAVRLVFLCWLERAETRLAGRDESGTFTKRQRCAFRCVTLAAVYSPWPWRQGEGISDHGAARRRVR